MSLFAPSHESLFITGGYQASFRFDLTFNLQTQGPHIAECVEFVRDRNHATIDASPETEEWWVGEVIRHRGKTNRNAECTPGYYNFEGETNRRHDGNYNGGMRQYCDHMADVRKDMQQHFRFGRPFTENFFGSGTNPRPSRHMIGRARVGWDDRRRPASRVAVLGDVILKDAA